MSIYEFIAEQLGLSGIKYNEEQLQKLDIIEYMVLEFAGALPSLQGTALTCIFLPGYTHGKKFFKPTGEEEPFLHGAPNTWVAPPKPIDEDGKKRSCLGFGLQKPMNEETIADFINKINVISKKFPRNESWRIHQPSLLETLYAIILLDETIEKAIKSSSLFIAAGDLSGFDLESLRLLRAKLNLYKIADFHLSALVDCLTEKISSHLLGHLLGKQGYRGTLFNTKQESPAVPLPRGVAEADSLTPEIFGDDGPASCTL